MRKEAVMKHFGGKEKSVRKVAQAFNVSTQHVYTWDDIVPEVIALKAERLSLGKLKFNERHYS